MNVTAKVFGVDGEGKELKCDGGAGLDAIRAQTGLTNTQLFIVLKLGIEN